jgi:hypothetical protein
VPAGQHGDDAIGLAELLRAQDDGLVAVERHATILREKPGGVAPGAAVERIVRIEPLDVSSDTTAYTDLVAETGVSWSPVGLAPPAGYLLNDLRHQAADQRKFVWVAYDGARAVGAAELAWREAPDNRDRAWLHFELRSVAALPGLAAAAAELASSCGRTVLTVEALRGSEESAWVAERGASFGSLEEHNVSRMASLLRSDIAELAAAVPSGYELVAWDGPAPDEIVAPYVRLVESMNDAPRDALTMEDWSYSPEQLRTWEAAVAARQHALWTVVARSVSTGELAGFNQLLVKPEWPEVVENEDTAVSVAHRGHGLGLWIKAVNLLRVLDERPEAVCVSTWNAASNSHMLRVNRRLGFVCEHVFESWELPAEKAL